MYAAMWEKEVSDQLAPRAAICVAKSAGELSQYADQLRSPHKTMPASRVSIMISLTY